MRKMTYDEAHNYRLWAIEQPLPTNETPQERMQRMELEYVSERTVNRHRYGNDRGPIVSAEQSKHFRK